MLGQLSTGGELVARKITTPKAPLLWRLRNWMSWEFIWGWLTVSFALGFSKLTGIPVLVSQLRAVKVQANGRREDYGAVGYRVVTTAFVNYMVDNLIAEVAAWGDFKFHDSGVGTTGAAVGDTDIETTDAESRVTGTQVEGAANEYVSVGTITYTSTLAITEHGLFNIVTAGTMMDRTVFSAINVVNTDTIEFTYTLTCAAGG